MVQVASIACPELIQEPSSALPGSGRYSGRDRGTKCTMMQFEDDVQRIWVRGYLSAGVIGEKATPFFNSHRPRTQALINVGEGG